MFGSPVSRWLNCPNHIVCLMLQTSETGEKELPLVGPVLIDDLYCASANNRKTIVKRMRQVLHSLVEKYKGEGVPQKGGKYSASLRKVGYFSPNIALFTTINQCIYLSFASLSKLRYHRYHREKRHIRACPTPIHRLPRIHVRIARPPFILFLFSPTGETLYTAESLLKSKILSFFR